MLNSVNIGINYSLTALIFIIFKDNHTLKVVL